MAVDDPFDMEWPDFDPLSKCVKCGHQIPEPEPVPQDPLKVAAAKDAEAKPVAKPSAKKETAAETAPPKVPMARPVKAAPPTVSYCNGEDCPSFEDEVPQHIHAFCDCCGYEWISKTYDESSNYSG